eukprot:TRINITY_DN13802_c0_g1_i1.p1 TRINITY_DN13802_c0_g1~~TRINITY_DN13802_c0_g1_i1.p1  ORF type:complete len:311 (-),score=64.27 TRINITY_DN13802_c0_g1_i1:102-1034(-)
MDSDYEDFDHPDSDPYPPDWEAEHLANYEENVLYAEDQEAYELEQQRRREIPERRRAEEIRERALLDLFLPDIIEAVVQRLVDQQFLNDLNFSQTAQSQFATVVPNTTPYVLRWSGTVMQWKAFLSSVISTLVDTSNEWDYMEPVTLWLKSHDWHFVEVSTLSWEKYYALKPLDLAPVNDWKESYPKVMIYLYAPKSSIPNWQSGLASIMKIIDHQISQVPKPQIDDMLTETAALLTDLGIEVPATPPSVRERFLEYDRRESLIKYPKHYWDKRGGWGQEAYEAKQKRESQYKILETLSLEEKLFLNVVD